MAEEVLSLLVDEQRSDGLIVDCTLGEGGHSSLLLDAWPGARVLGFDADSVMLGRAREVLSPWGSRVEYRNGYFDDLLGAQGSDTADAILMDLGVSMFHFKGRGKGFAFQGDEPLDMRLGDAARSAADIVNGEREEELARIFYTYGDERRSRPLARAIVQQRSKSPITSSAQLREVITSVIYPRKGASHPATRIFQALRIAVNDELGRLERAIAEGLRVLKVGGRMGIITFHSLEDRVVKHSYRLLGKNCRCPEDQAQCTCEGQSLVKIITRKPLVPSSDEIARNPASRSAKFRVFEKLAVKQ